jgi:hypothetical protein
MIWIRQKYQYMLLQIKCLSRSIYLAIIYHIYANTYLSSTPQNDKWKLKITLIGICWIKGWILLEYCILTGRVFIRTCLTISELVVFDCTIIMESIYQINKERTEIKSRDHFLTRRYTDVITFFCAIRKHKYSIFLKY